VTPATGTGRRRVLATGAALAALCVATPAAAQLALEVRGGGAVGNASQSLSGLDIAPRPTFGVGLSLKAPSPVSVYAAFNRAAFGCVEGLCRDRQVTFISQGVAAGARLEHGRLPFVQAGVLYHRLQTRADTGDDPGAAGLGYELGGGYAFPVGHRLEVLTSLAYRRHDARSGGVDGYAALVTGELGARYRLR
jgi:hypothetical protein